VRILCLLFIIGYLSVPLYSQNPEDEIHFNFWVDGVCGSCKARIEKTALEFEHVIKATWDPDSKSLHIDLSDSTGFDARAFELSIAMVGHDTEHFKTLENIYNELPDCCRYRESDIQNGEHMLRGVIQEKASNGKIEPLIGVSVFWEGTSEGVSTNYDGEFEIERSFTTNNLVLSYVGFANDTIQVHNEQDVEIMLNAGVQLDVVEMTGKKRSMSVSFLDPIKSINISEKELTKAACCNLAESFETNPAVDVSFTDAVTGTRRIEMLGLAGPYVQITRELIPDIRGLSAIHGFTYTPGPWIEGIQLNMGTGSVVNGFEAIAGQINVELKKPNNPNTEDLNVNLYANQGGRSEINLFGKYELNPKLSTALFLHGSTRPFKIDQNKDGFLDMPVGTNYILMNRWKFSAGNGLEGQFGVKATLVDQQSGQLDYDPSDKPGPFWGAENQVRRIESWYKTGIVFQGNSRNSLGFQLSGVWHDQQSYFGAKAYDAKQESLFANLIFQHLFSNTDHQLRTGISFVSDNIDEDVLEQNYIRSEKIPGIFTEYSYNNVENWTVVGGMRIDHHNSYGIMWTPRLNVRYLISPSAVIRAAAGKGYRTANLFTEQIGLFASNRAWFIESQDSELPYGLKQEVAWNVGLNYTQDFFINGKSLIFSADAFHTWFEDQLIVDMDVASDEIHVYNLDGASYSTSLQMQVDYSLTDKFDIRLAYRFNDVQIDQKNGRLQKALSNRHRAFLNLAYESDRGWKFDGTFNWQGAKRIPDTSSSPEEFQLEEYSPSFVLLNGQVSKVWGKHLEIYAGGENLLNFRQEDPIVSAADPFGSNFDASMIWGPVFGRNIYLGMRYKLFR
jgi:outer membrane receptor for ferrienterochelin and colicin